MTGQLVESHNDLNGWRDLMSSLPQLLPFDGAEFAGRPQGDCSDQPLADDQRETDPILGMRSMHWVREVPPLRLASDGGNIGQRAVHAAQEPVRVNREGKPGHARLVPLRQYIQRVAAPDCQPCTLGLHHAHEVRQHSVQRAGHIVRLGLQAGKKILGGGLDLRERHHPRYKAPNALRICILLASANQDHPRIIRQWINIQTRRVQSRLTGQRGGTGSVPFQRTGEPGIRRVLGEKLRQDGLLLPGQTIGSVYKPLPALAFGQGSPSRACQLAGFL